MTNAQTPASRLSCNDLSRIRTISLLVLVIVFGSIPGQRKDPDAFHRKVTDYFRTGVLHTGDLLFRRGLSLSSQAVLLSDRDAEYSHVGFVVVINGRSYVIHAVPGESVNCPEHLRFEPVAAFLSAGKAINAGLYRVVGISPGNLDKARQWAVHAFLQRALFDDAYDLQSDSKLYCTELLWKCYRAAGIDLVDGRLETLAIPALPSRIILPGTLIHSRYLTRIMTF